MIAEIFPAPFMQGEKSVKLVKEQRVFNSYVLFIKLLLSETNIRI
jgi:hypothetical protein